jgi:hypothetical protein
MSQPKYYGLNELREMFLHFFETKDHLRLPSFSLIPQNDASLLLINSGMAPMKPYFTGEQEPPSVLLSATRLLYHMGNIFRDNAPIPAANGVQIDHKRLAQLRQKRVALGHKPDDHELEQQQGYSMRMHT